MNVPQEFFDLADRLEAQGYLAEANYARLGAVLHRMDEIRSTVEFILNALLSSVAKYDSKLAETIVTSAFDSAMAAYNRQKESGNESN